MKLSYIILVALVSKWRVATLGFSSPVMLGEPYEQAHREL